MTSLRDNYRDLFNYQRRVLASPELTRAAKYVAIALALAEDTRTGKAKRTVQQLMADTYQKRAAVYGALRDLVAGEWIDSAGPNTWVRNESTHVESAEEHHEESTQMDAPESTCVESESTHVDEKSTCVESAPLTDSTLLERERKNRALEDDDGSLAARVAELRRVHDRETGAAHKIPIPPADGKYHLGLLELVSLLCELVPEAQGGRWLTQSNLEDALRGYGRRSREYANAADKVREVHAALEDVGLRDPKDARRVVGAMLSEWWALPFTQTARSPFATLEPVALLAKVERQERERGPVNVRPREEPPATAEQIAAVRASFRRRPRGEAGAA